MYLVSSNIYQAKLIFVLNSESILDTTIEAQSKCLGGLYTCYFRANNLFIFDLVTSRADLNIERYVQDWFKPTTFMNIGLILYALINDCYKWIFFSKPFYILCQFALY